MSKETLPERSNDPVTFSAADRLKWFEASTHLYEVKQMWFNNKSLHLDGYKFIGCRFDRCRLEISSSNFELRNCLIDNDCILIYGRNISKVIRLFNNRVPLAFEKFPEFCPTRNNDGTITITGG